MRRPVTDSRRWRVYVKGQFACVVQACSQPEALAMARDLTTVREAADAR